MLFIFFLIVIGIFVLSIPNTRKRDYYVKMFILFSFIAIPFFSSFFSKFIVFGMYIRLPLVFSIIYTVLAIVYFIIRPLNLKIPKYVTWFFIYVVYSTLNNFLQSSNRADNWMIYSMYEYIFPMAFIVLIENLSYTEGDIKKLIKILSIVIIGSFIVSIVQFTISPFFYSSVNIESIEATYRTQHIYGNVYRSYSLYSGLKAHDCIFAIGYLFIIFLFLNIKNINKKYTVLTILIFVSGILTFGRDVWLILFIAGISFFYYKFRKTWILYFGLLSVFVFIIITIWGPALINTDIYRLRIVSKTYESRIFTPIYYFEYFFGTNPFFGYGESSGLNTDFTKYYHVIHVFWINLLFQNGIIGLIIFTIFLYHIYKRGRLVYRFTGNPVFIVMIVAYVAVYFTAPYDLINYYGNYFMFLYLAMNYKLYVENEDINRLKQNKTMRI